MILALSGITVVSILLFVYVHITNCRLLDRIRDKDTLLAAVGAVRAASERELILKRALEDMAFAEIDRARFALEVAYGKER